MVALAAFDIDIGAMVFEHAVDAGYIAAHRAIRYAMRFGQARRGGVGGMADRLKDRVKSLLPKQL